ncbi:hypothetical protein HF882_03960 [Victivallis vadensis]|uniref:Uncharacterized protein n=1 Tax=Victivallis vadensis TaxID=172901 RepID=A0A848AU15_9BACT|nr:hypothetical protein [Victivallis vadensis]NMD85733.1 hypothetical protein [Victivallis vadensis]
MVGNKRFPTVQEAAAIRTPNSDRPRRRRSFREYAFSEVRCSSCGSYQAKHGNGHVFHGCRE